MTERKRGWIQPGISAGNVLTIIVLLTALAMGWARMEAALADHERRISENEQDLKVVSRDQRAFEAGFAELRTDMKHLLQEVSRTRETLERLDRESNRQP